MFYSRSKLSILFANPLKREDKLFADVYGCDDIKKPFRMALDSKDASSILLTGPPASAKTLTTVFNETERFTPPRLQQCFKIGHS